MGNPGLSVEQMQQALDALAAFDGNESAAARHLGIPRTTFQNRIRVARDPTRGLSPNVAATKPRIRVPARSSMQAVPDTFGRSIRVFVFGCAHDAPSIPDKSRFANAGRLARQLMPDYIVDLGDTMDLDSLSSHAAPGSMDDRNRPFFRADIASLHEAQAAFDGEAPSPDDVPRYHLHGNHEYRSDRYEKANPAAQDVFTLEIDQVYARFGWSIKRFKEWLYLDGVGFTHVPINGMGKEIGGVNANQTVSRESTHSVVWSHTHKREFVERPKLGIGNGIQVYNTGCFMPQGYLKAYAGLSMTGWTYGVSELTIRNGQIESARNWSELELREMFGSKAA